MTIIQQPDNLSLSLNLKSYILKSAKSITFELKKGADLLLSQRYTPGADQQVKVDLRDVIHASLSYELRDVAETYEQAGIVADFVAVIDGHPHTFRVLRGGVDRLADTATNFLKGNWLTWQPTEKKVTYHSPEFLTYYAVEACVVKLKAYFSDTDSQVITVGNLAAGKAYTLPMQYGVVVGKLANRLPGVYDVWVETPAGARLTYIQRYRAEGMKSLHEDWMLFENSLGGLDTFRAYGVKGLESKHTHNVANLGDDSEEYDVDTQRVFSKETGYLTADEMKWLLDFFPSLKKYIYTGNYLRRITVLESDVNYENLFAPESYKFSYVFSDARPLLNLPREEQGAEVLDIVIPNVGNFTLPPRLNEVGRIPLSEGVLFPVQQPYSEKWGTTTIASIATAIGELLEAQASGGGVGHRHGNIDLLNAMQMLGEYLTVFGKKLSAGYADIAGDVVDGKFIRKNRPDTTEHLLRLLGGAHVGNAVDSMTAGAGTVMTADGRIQADSIEVRQSMKVIELIINRLQGMENDFVFSPTRKVLRVEAIDATTYRLFLDPKMDGDLIPYREGNILYSIVNDLLTGGSNFYTSYSRVLSLNQNEYSITVSLYPDSEVPGGKNYAPVAGYNISRRGDVRVIENNQDAQSWYLSSSEGRLLFLQNVVKPVLDDYNYALSVGKFPKIKAIEKLPIRDNEVGVLAQTIVAEHFYQFDYNGDVVPKVVDRGEWSLSVAQSDKPYRKVEHATVRPNGTEYTLLEQHGVWRFGCFWGCLVDKTTEEPKWNAQGWQLLQGDKSYRLSFISSRGWQFFKGKVDTEITVVIEHAGQEIASEIMNTPGVEVEWLRDSGNVPSDNTWKPSYIGGMKHRITLTNADMPSGWGGNVREVMFICRVYIPDGHQTVENYIGINL